MSEMVGWRTLEHYESICPYCPYAPTYSPSGKYLMDYRLNSREYYGHLDIVISNLEAGYMKKYATIQESYEVISCYYWLSDQEIVVITQGEKPTNVHRESVFYRIYALDHQKGLAALILKWKYMLPRNAETLESIEICSNPLVIDRQAFCIVQVGFELVLFPWDVRERAPSYPPIRIRISITEFEQYGVRAPNPDRPFSCDICCYKDSIYLELENTEQRITTTPVDRLLKLDLSRLDLTCSFVVFNKDSQEISLKRLSHLSDGIELLEEYDKTWSQGNLIVKSSTDHLVVIDTNKWTVSKEQLFSDEKWMGYYTCTVYNNKVLILRDVKEDGMTDHFQYKVLRSKYLPLQSLWQMCREKVYFTDDYAEYVRTYRLNVLQNLVFTRPSTKNRIIHFIQLHIGNIKRRLRRYQIRIYIWYRFGLRPGRQ